MARLKHTIAGSSIVEVVVASLVFLAVFAISLSTVTGFTLRRDEGYVLLEAERQLEACAGRYGDGTRFEETYEETYDWGRIEIRISPYGDYGKVQAVVLTARLDGSRKSIEHRFLTLKRNE